MGMNSPSSFALPGLLSGNELPQDAVAIRDPRSVQKMSSTEIPGRLQKNPALLPGRRVVGCFLSASGRVSAPGRRVSGGSCSFRCGGARHFGRRRWRRRGSWTCRRSDSFSFLLARREKRGPGQNADVFLHSWRRTLL